jgi:hypothetical protein
VEHRQRDLSGGAAARVAVHRDAAAVVDHRHRVVDVQRDVDLVAESGQGFVDRVVDDLVDEMMEPRRAGRADVHRRPLADGLEALQNLDLVGAVVIDPGSVAVVRRRRRRGIHTRVGGSGGALVVVLRFELRHQEIACVHPRRAFDACSSGGMPGRGRIVVFGQTRIGMIT